MIKHFPEAKALDKKFSPQKGAQWTMETENGLCGTELELDAGESLTCRILEEHQQMTVNFQ